MRTTIARANARALPTISKRQPPAGANKDSELLALIDEAKQLADLEAKAEKRLDAIARRMREPKFPTVARGELPHLLLRPPDHGVYTKENLSELRTGLRIAEIWMRRAPEIIAAVEQYEAELDRVRRESGFLGAEARCAQLEAKREKLWERIVDRPAKTTRGLLAKLAFAGRFTTLEQVKEFGDSTADAIALSAAFDTTLVAEGRAQ